MTPPAGSCSPRPRAGRWPSPAYQQAIGTVVAQAKELPGVTSVIDPATGTDRLARSAGRVRAGASSRARSPRSRRPPRPSWPTIAAANEVDGLQIELGGGAVAQAPAIGSTEGIGVIVAMVVLLITFGSIVAAGLPMLTALIGVGTGMAGILWASSVIEMSNTAPILALMLGLAVGIDYALFIVSRHRNQVKAGMADRRSRSPGRTAPPAPPWCSPA